MRIAAAIVAGLIALVTLLVLVAFVVGRSLPVRHRATRETRLHASPDAVYAIVTDVARFAEWRSGVTRVEPQPAVDARRRWREIAGGDAILYEAVAEDSGRRLVTRIADPKLPFGGTWTYDLVPDGSGTRLTITEDGEVYHPIFRFASRYVFGHHRTLETYLRDLEKRAVR